MSVKYEELRERICLVGELISLAQAEFGESLVVYDAAQRYLKHFKYLHALTAVLAQEVLSEFI